MTAPIRQRRGVAGAVFFLGLNRIWELNRRSAQVANVCGVSIAFHKLTVIFYLNIFFVYNIFFGTRINGIILEFRIAELLWSRKEYNNR